jgi:hypothetical protein
MIHYRPNLVYCNFDYSFFLVKEKGKGGSIVYTAPEGLKACVVNKLNGIDIGTYSQLAIHSNRS